MRAAEGVLVEDLVEEEWLRWSELIAARKVHRGRQ